MVLSNIGNQATRSSSKKHWRHPLRSPKQRLAETSSPKDDDLPTSSPRRKRSTSRLFRHFPSLLASKLARPLTPAVVEVPPRVTQAELDQGEVLKDMMDVKAWLLRSRGIVVKRGPAIREGEANVMREVTRRFGKSIPIPKVLNFYYDEENRGVLITAIVPGQALDLAWDSLSKAARNVAIEQIGDILKLLHSTTAPSAEIVPLAPFREGRELSGYYIPQRYYASEEAMLQEWRRQWLATPGHFGGVRDCSSFDAAIAKISEVKHRIVLSHGDVAGRNLMVDEAGNITGVLDWETAGWFPEPMDLASLASRCFERQASMPDKWLLAWLLEPEMEEEIMAYRRLFSCSLNANYIL